MIGGEDNAGLTCCPCSVVEQCNLVGLGAAEMCSLTTVCMTNMHVAGINERQKLVAQLISKQNARSNNNNGARLCKQLDSVLNHDDGLATTSRHNDLTLVGISHRVESTLLVGT